MQNKQPSEKDKNKLIIVKSAWLISTGKWCYKFALPISADKVFLHKCYLLWYELDIMLYIFINFSVDTLNSHVQGVKHVKKKIAMEAKNEALRNQGLAPEDKVVRQVSLSELLDITWNEYFLRYIRFELVHIS